MSYLYDMGLRAPICNGCSLAKYKYLLGDKFLLLPSGIYELDAEPSPGQGEPQEHNGRPIRFVMWGMSYQHSDECYHWKPPQKWRMKDKETILVTDMTDSHLRNALNYVQERRPRDIWVKVFQNEIDRRKHLTNSETEV